MTSGEFRFVPIDLIWVNPDERQRSKLDGVDRIAGSVRKRGGFINPPLLTRDYELVCGEQRVEAAKQNGHTGIVCQITDVTDPVELRVLRLEENTKRTPLSWPDERRVISELHKIYCEQAKARGENWTQEDTAREHGMDQTQVSKYLKIAEKIEVDDPEVLKAIADGESCWAVTKMIEVKEERKALEQQREFERKVNAKAGQKPPRSSIICADFTQWVKTYDDDRFNFVHCDFPYGIDTDKRQQGNAVAIHGGYEDTEETYWRLVKALCSNLNRLCTDSCHYMFWFSPIYYRETLDFLERYIDVNPFPLIWHKLDNKGLLPDLQREPRRIYETCFFGSRGDRKILEPVSNLFAAPTERSDHMSTKPVEVLKYFFRMFVDENTYMLDPTCGSGTALRAADYHKAKHVLASRSTRSSRKGQIFACGRRDGLDPINPSWTNSVSKLV
jgi:ParB-like chromosome segregation protein Spo0J